MVYFDSAPTAYFLQLKGKGEKKSSNSLSRTTQYTEKGEINK